MSFKKWKFSEKNRLNLINLNLTLIFLVVILVFLILNYKEIAAQIIDKRKIDFCCTWGSELKDGVLTYNIKKDSNNDLERIVNLAFSEWEKDLNNIQFKNVKDAAADIEIKFKKRSNNQEGGHALIYFNDKGFIDHVEISVSKTSGEAALNQTMLDHLTRHEIGHALGLGHSQFPHSIMYPVVNGTVTKISKCEIDAVQNANNWKFVKNDKKPKMLEQSVYICTQ